MNAVLDLAPQHADAAAARDQRALRFLLGGADAGSRTLMRRLLCDSGANRSDAADTRPREPASRASHVSVPTEGFDTDREQGTASDVTWRRFATPKRRFVMADAPSHEQQAHHMITAAAGSDAVVVLVDITKIDWHATPLTLPPQTRHLALLAQLLRVPSIVFGVSQIDALAQPQPTFEAVRTALQTFAHDAGLAVAAILPLSALRGDNLDAPIDEPWYSGPSLLQVLEGLPSAEQHADGDLLLSIQCVARAGFDGGEAQDAPRTVWGRIARGQVRAGDTVQLYPSGERAVVTALQRGADGITHAMTGQSVGLVLDRQLDASVGDWVGTPDTLLGAQRFGATLAWLDPEPAVIGRRYLVHHGNRWVQARIASIGHRIDIDTLKATDAYQLALNDIGHVVVELQQPLPIEPYAHNRVAGSMIVVDPAHNRTSGVLLVNVVR